MVVWTENCLISRWTDDLTAGCVICCTSHCMRLTADIFHFPPDVTLPRNMLKDQHHQIMLFQLQTDNDYRTCVPWKNLAWMEPFKNKLAAGPVWKITTCSSTVLVFSTSRSDVFASRCRSSHCEAYPLPFQRFTHYIQSENGAFGNLWGGDLSE